MQQKTQFMIRFQLNAKHMEVPRREKNKKNYEYE